jgi:cell wall-associated NlpC family hydrolase
MLACIAATPAVAVTPNGGTTEAVPQQPAASPAPMTASKPLRGTRARIVGGRAVAPPGAPRRVVAAIAAANSISRKPYRWGGGHGSFFAGGYDCSGAVSFVLRGAGALRSPLTSGGFTRWGRPGRGRWITVYAHGGHVYMMIAGLRFDTGWRSRNIRRLGIARGSGPRWGYARSTRGFRARHPGGL